MPAARSWIRWGSGVHILALDPHPGGMGIDPDVVELASRQGGYVTRAQLIRLGMSPSAVDRRVAGGVLPVVSPGVYRIIPSSDHADLIRGAILSLPEAVASHESAAHLHGFPSPPNLEPTVTVPSRTTHLFPGVTVRRCDDLDATDVTILEGIPVTTIPRTIFDLAGVLSIKRVDRIVESLVIAGNLRVKNLEQVARRLGRRGKRGTVATRSIVEARGESTTVDATVLERKGGKVLADSGLATPSSEYPIPWAPRHRFDDAYPDVRLAIEWDSRSWHLQSQAMEADRIRDRQAALRGWLVVRFTWSDVTERPDEVAVTVASLLQARSA
jgi:hypothetical protein